MVSRCSPFLLLLFLFGFQLPAQAQFDGPSVHATAKMEEFGLRFQATGRVAARAMAAVVTDGKQYITSASGSLLIEVTDLGTGALYIGPTFSAIGLLGEEMENYSVGALFGWRTALSSHVDAYAEIGVDYLTGSKLVTTARSTGVGLAYRF